MTPTSPPEPRRTATSSVIVSARRPAPSWKARATAFARAVVGPPPVPSLASRVAAMTQLARLLHAGLPLPRALTDLAAASTGHLADSLRVVAERLDRGSSLTNAVAAVPGFLGPREAALVAVGERTGHLPEVLDRVVEGWTQVREDRRTLLSSLAYPMVLIVLSVLLQPLPDAVRCGARCYVSTVAWGMVALGSAVGFVALLGWTVNRARLGPALRNAAWRLPIVRTVYRPRVRADVLHTLSTGLAAGLGVPETLALAEKAAADPSGARACRRIAERVAAGDTLAEAIRSAGIVPAGELVSLAGGERSGTLPDALARLAADQGRSYRTRLAWSIRIATTLCFLAVGAWIGARIVGTLTGSVLGAEGDALNEIQREIPGLFRPLNPR